MNTFAFYMHHTNHWGGHRSSHHWQLSGLTLFLTFVVSLAIAAILAFEIWMFFDCVLDRKMPSKNKVWWIVGMLLLHPIVAIFYYFIVHRPRKQQPRK